MSRKVKNIIMITIIIIVCIANGFTIKLAKESGEEKKSRKFYWNNSAILAKNGANLTIKSATINLTNNTIVNNDSTGNFFRAQKDSWGNIGSNGENVTLIMTQHIVILILMDINYM